MRGSQPDKIMTGPFAYVRFHGSHGARKYHGTYPDATLDEWAVWLAGALSAGKAVYAYFNNDVDGHAPRDAIRLREEIHKIAAFAA
jgi:uncharacterized protein YecE (DUF72 family)